MGLHWSLAPFTALYESLEQGTVDNKLIEDLKDDLTSLVQVPKKNQSSRQALEKGTVKFLDGEYELNQEFKIAAATLSDELDIDELIAAELLHNSTGLGITLNDNAKAAHYLRKQNILAIVSYIFNTGDQSLVDAIYSQSFESELLKSFQYVSEELESIHQIVQKARILGQFNSDDFTLRLTFRRDFLKAQHETLGEIFYGLVSRNLINRTHFIKYLNYVASFDADDFFIVHFLPALLLFVSKLKTMDEEDVKQLHSDLLMELKKEDIYRLPIKVFVILAFCSYFIDWCKSSAKRLKEFDFEIAIEAPMTSAVQQGALEELLIIAAETTDNKFDMFYDIRTLLEQHLPRLVQKKIFDVNEEETKKLRSADSQSTSTVYIITKEYHLSENLTHLLTETLDSFVQCFISDAAFLLVKIKDSEEDSLLSGEDFLLDDISKDADLERFYLAVYYIYANRQSLITQFWEDRESNAFGFIEWASKGEDLLMRSTFSLMLAALTAGPDNSNHVYHFVAGSDKLSWSSIIEILNVYYERIYKFEHDGQDENNDLTEETILLISSFLTLLHQVSINSEAVKGYFDDSLLDVLFRFLTLDTPLVGPILHVIRALVSKEESRCFSIWERLDSWIFASNSLPAKEAFQSKLVSFPDVIGFIDLLEALLMPRTSPIDKFNLPYPKQFGYPHRKFGIAPYLEFILSDVFFHSPQLYFTEKVALQEPILRIINHCLSSFDIKLILNSFPAGVDLNKVVSTGDFATFVQANPAPIALNFLFQEKIYKTLLDITSTGIDNISDKHFEEKQVQVVDLSLAVITKILDLEVVYVDELIAILKRDNPFYLPTTVGTHGLRSLYDAILFNLPVVAHISLYVGSAHLPIADKSIRLLSRFATSPQFGSNVGAQSVGKTRLLTILDSINESVRIKHMFISQLESEISSPENLNIKVLILNFLNSNLSLGDRCISVSHFLLGFDLRNGIGLGDKNTSTFIASDTSALRSLLYILESGLTNISSQNIDYAPIRLTSFALEIVLKLSRNPLTSSPVLDYISNYSLLEILLETPRVDLHTRWSGEQIDTDLTKVTTFNSGPGIGAFLALLNQRNFILKYFSLELHRTSVEGAISKTSNYIDQLTSGDEKFLGPPRVLAFLDVLEFALSEVPTVTDELQFFGDVDLNLDLNKINLSDSCDGLIFNLNDLDSLLDLQTRQLHIEGRYRTDSDEQNQLLQIEDTKAQLKRPEVFKQNSLISIPTLLKSNEDEVLNERNLIRSRFANYLSALKFKSYQLSSLHSWVQLIQVIVTDGKLDPVKRSNFILEVLQAIVPRIDDYIERDVLYAEELVSLCVSLYDIYHQDRQAIEENDPNITVGYDRLYSLFKSCINGILSPSSTLSLRSDLYVLANKYLTWILKYKEITREILQSIKLSSERLITVICNDVIGGEGPTRITGILLLESIFQLSSINQLNFVLNTLVKNNLLLLLVKSIKRTDDTLSLSHDTKITLDSLLYELTAFKATLSLLIRIAETRQGAQQLLQSEIFQTIRACSFLMIDPDLGLDLVFDETTVKTSTFVKVNLNLDTPLSFDNESKGISLFEFLVPTFQLVTAILLSTSSENKLTIQQVRNLLKHFKKLVVGVLKRDVLIESKRENGIYKEGVNGSGLRNLVNLFVLLSTLTEFNDKN